MGKIGVGVIGLGNAGMLHAAILKHEVPEAKLVCVSDVSERVASETGQQLEVDGIVGHQELLERDDVDAVVIAVPTQLHMSMLLSALEAGKHAFVEKPLARSLEEARDAIRKVSTSDLVVQVGYMRRFDEAYSEAKSRIDEGLIGRPILYRAVAHDPSPPTGWATDPGLSGGIFYDMLSHDFDMARHLMRSEVSTAYAVGSCMLYTDIGNKGDYDTASALLTFESGAHGYVEGVRKSTYGYDLRTEVVGSEATVSVGNMGDSVITFADKQGIKQRGLRWFMGRFRQAFVDEDRNFIKSIMAHSPPKVSILDGLKAIEIAEACRTSVGTMKPVSLKTP